MLQMRSLAWRAEAEGVAPELFQGAVSILEEAPSCLLDPAQWVMAERSLAAAFSLRSAVAASSSVSTIITPFIYARLCWEGFPLSLDVCYKPKAHV